MRDINIWTISCAWWGGVRVRAHVSLLVVAVLALYLTGRLSTSEDPWLSVLHGFMWVGILLASVVLHELGHALAAWRLGGSVDLIVLGPLGGMHPPNVPHESHREVLVALAGPLVNLILATLAGVGLIFCGARVNDLLLQPLFPTGMLEGTNGLVALRMAFWINWLLLLVNLLPAAPLDGGRALRSVLWPVTGYRLAVRVVSRSGMLIALVLCLLVLRVYHPRDFRLVPAWTPLVLMAIYLYFSARQETNRVEEQDDDDEFMLLTIESSQTENVPAGTYQCRFAGLSVIETQKGKAYRWEFIANDGRKISGLSDAVLPPKPTNKTGRWVAALSCQPLTERLSVESDAFVGKPYLVIVSPKENGGTKLETFSPMPV